MFCNYCGKPLNPGEVCSCQQPQQTQQPQQPYYGGYFTTEPASPAIAILRKHGSSVLMLLVAILFTVGTVFNIVNSVVTSQTLMEVMAYGYEYSDAYTAGSNVGSVIGAVFGSFVNYLYIAALFMLYKNCKKPTTGYIKTAGLTIFKVFSVISIVCFALLTVLCAIFGGVVIGLGEELAREFEYLFYDMGIYDVGLTGAGITVAVAMVFFLLAAVCVFEMFVQIGLVKTINSLKNTCTTGAPALKISRFYAVMLILGAAFNIFFGVADFVSLVAYCCLGTASILGAVLLFKIRKDMTNYAMSTVQPNYVAPAYAPNDGPTAYYYNPQQQAYAEPQQPVYPAAEPAPVAEEPVIEEVPAMEIPAAPAAEIPEIEIPAAEPTAEPVAEAAEKLVNDDPLFTTCPKCGKAYAAVANFCVYCGEPNPNK